MKKGTEIFTPGTLVRWIGPDKRVGPAHLNHIAIRNGEVRKVISMPFAGVWLEGKNGTGAFGAVDPANLEILPTTRPGVA